MRSTPHRSIATCLRLACLVGICVAAARSPRAEAAPGHDADLSVARKARPAVVRIRWRDDRFSQRTAVRNAIVVRSDGLLVMAGAPLPRGGTLRAVFADGRELDAEFLAADLPTALSLLRVRAAGLPTLRLRTEPSPKPVAGSGAKPKAAPPAAGKARTPSTPGSSPVRRLPQAGGKLPAVAAGAAPPPLRAPPIGLHVVMVTSDGSVAMGAVRSRDRPGFLFDRATRRPRPTTALLGLALAAVDTDVGAPLLDAQGRVAGLVVGRKSVVAPERGEAASRLGLRLRPEPRQAVAVPAAVVRLVWPLLERFRRVPRAQLGLRTLMMDDALRTQLDLHSGGHVVRGLDEGGAAARGGLRLHDVIVGVEGRPIAPGRSLHDVLLPYRPGRSVKLSVYRAGARISLVLQLEASR